MWRGLQVIEKMERETGLEPATSSLGSWHSTTELLPLVDDPRTYLIQRLFPQPENLPSTGRSITQALASRSAMFGTCHVRHNHPERTASNHPARAASRPSGTASTYAALRCRRECARRAAVSRQAARRSRPVAPWPRR